MQQAHIKSKQRADDDDDRPLLVSLSSVSPSAKPLVSKRGVQRSDIHPVIANFDLHHPDFYHRWYDIYTKRCGVLPNRLIVLSIHV